MGLADAVTDTAPLSSPVIPGSRTEANLNSGLAGRLLLPKLRPEPARTAAQNIAELKILKFHLNFPRPTGRKCEGRRQN
jgi:hypothetical protein